MARILVCSDDALEVETLARELAAEGHEVVLARDGLEAYEKATAAADMVFLSEHMPVFDAYEACRMLRQDPDISPTLPVVLLAREAPNPRHLEEAGFTDYFLTSRAGTDLRDVLVRYLGPLFHTRS